MFEKIKNLCKDNGLTVAQLEENLGWSRSIYKWDMNTPSVTKVKAVADYFGVTVDYLLSDKECVPTDIVSFNDDMKVLIEVASKCSPNELKTAIRLIQALRGECIYDAPTSPKIAQISEETPLKV